MKGKPRKSPREKDLTSRYMSGNLDEERVEERMRFSRRGTDAEQHRITRTSQLRADQAATDAFDLPPGVPPKVGSVIQVFSVYSEVEHEGHAYLCVVRKTLSRISATAIVVGDQVQFRITEAAADLKVAALPVAPPVALPTTLPDAPPAFVAAASPQGVIDEVLPRKTVLTRTNSFRGTEQQPIVANAQQMLIVASVFEPAIKWGLIDRMIVAALAGGLKPIICLNKSDLAESNKDAKAEFEFAATALAHYATMDVPSLQTSVTNNAGIDALRELLHHHVTVLSGHSGVGKSSLIRAVQPSLDLRVGEVSTFTGKGRHTTTFARHYPLEGGGAVIDTPGVKLFGLWGVTADNLPDFFPDIAAGTAPAWRVESYSRMQGSLGGKRRG